MLRQPQNKLPEMKKIKKKKIIIIKRIENSGKLQMVIGLAFQTLPAHIEIIPFKVAFSVDRPFYQTTKITIFFFEMNAHMCEIVSGSWIFQCQAILSSLRTLGVFDV